MNHSVSFKRGDQIPLGSVTGRALQKDVVTFSYRQGDWTVCDNDVVRIFRELLQMTFISSFLRYLSADFSSA